MKKYNYLLTYLLCILFCCGCQQEQGLVSQPKHANEAVAQTLFAELSVATDELRIAQIVDPATGHTIRPQLSDKDLNIRVCVRREQGGTEQHQTLRFVKQSNDQSVSYRGNIKVPTDGSGDYLLSAIVLGEEGGDTYARLSGNDVEVLSATELSLAEGTVLKTNIPYIVENEPIYIAPGGRSITPIALTFKPSGTLLRVQLSNATQTEQTFTAITIKSNAFFPTWSYDLSRRQATNLRAGYRANTDAWEQRYPITPVTLPAGATAEQYYYIWVMPRGVEASDIKTEVFVENSAGESLLAASRSAIPKEGGLRFALQVGKKSLPVPSDVNSTVAPGFPGGKFPWERFAGVFVMGDKDEHGFYPVELPTEISPIGVYGEKNGTILVNYPSEVKFQLPQLPEGSPYKIPTQAELATLLPTLDFSNYRPREVSLYNDPRIKKTIERVCFSDEDYLLTSEYIGVEAGKTYYAIRFSGWNNGMRMVYRYQWGGALVQGSPNRLIISMKFIGNDLSYNIQTLPSKGETFWADAHKLYFPLITYYFGSNPSKTRYPVSNPWKDRDAAYTEEKLRFNGVYVTRGVESNVISAKSDYTLQHYNSAVSPYLSIVFFK